MLGRGDQSCFREGPLWPGERATRARARGSVVLGRGGQSCRREGPGGAYARWPAVPSRLGGSCQRERGRSQSGRASHVRASVQVVPSGAGRSCPWVGAQSRPREVVSRARASGRVVPARVGESCPRAGAQFRPCEVASRARARHTVPPARGGQSCPREWASRARAQAHSPARARWSVAPARVGQSHPHEGPSSDAPAAPAATQTPTAHPEPLIDRRDQWAVRRNRIRRSAVFASQLCGTRLSPGHRDAPARLRTVDHRRTRFLS